MKEEIQLHMFENESQATNKILTHVIDGDVSSAAWAFINVKDRMIQIEDNNGFKGGKTNADITVYSYVKDKDWTNYVIPAVILFLKNGSEVIVASWDKYKEFQEFLNRQKTVEKDKERNESINAMLDGIKSTLDIL